MRMNSWRWNLQRFEERSEKRGSVLFENEIIQLSPSALTSYKDLITAPITINLNLYKP